MSIRVRTISTLPKIDTVSDNDLLEISQCIQQDIDVGGVYSSTGIKYGDLYQQIEKSAADHISNTFNLKSGTDPINVSEVSRTVNALKSEDVQVSGTKMFQDTPQISLTTKNDNDMDDSSVVNVRKAKKIINEYADHYSTASYLERNPLNSLDAECKKFSGTKYTEKDSDNTFFYWHIGHGQNDSSYFEDESGNNTVKIDKSGLLNIIGWLADDGNAIAQESWVGLFTKVYIKEENRTQWIPISIVPWIQGKKSSIMQYVAFNGVGIAKGSELKIMTGFPVNGNNSGLGSGNSLTFKDYGYTSNTFIGYVVQK